MLIDVSRIQLIFNIIIAFKIVFSYTRACRTCIFASIYIKVYQNSWVFPEIRGIPFGSAHALCMPAPPLSEPHTPYLYSRLPITAPFHPPVAATAKVRAADKLRTSDLRAPHGIELRASVEIHNSELYSSK
jgi:hypothetical protein